jgi:ketosteroid isomerase-like protein
MTSKQLVASVFSSLGEGDARPLVSAMRDDVRWTVIGSASWSKSYEGRKAVIEELFGRLQARMAGRIRTVPDRVLADGDVVVVEAHGENTTVDGEPYENRYCFVIRVEDGKLAELTEYMDTALVERVLGP